MTATLTIKLSDEVLEALRGGKAINIKMATPAGRGGQPGGGGDAQPRPGTLPARLIDWASGLGRSFRTAEVQKQFKLSRAHASMLMSRLAGGAHPIERLQRGVYQHRAAGADGGNGAAQPREGTLPAQVLDWAAKRGPFQTADVQKRFGLTRTHASQLVSTMAKGPYGIRRVSRGVYGLDGAAATSAPTRRRKTVKKRK